MYADFERMVEYYGCTPIIYPTILKLHRGLADKSKIEQYPMYSVAASEWSTFILQPEGHERKVIAFQIELGKVERALIGWASTNWTSEKDARNSKGVGEDAGSIALDCCSSRLLFDGNSYETDPLNIEEGSVVRCEVEGNRWLVNGEVVVSPETNAIVSTANGLLYPAFSGKGLWRITEVVLDNSPYLPY
jgi:hypothetical protein